MEYRTQILIAGGGLGGCAAALAAARSGAHVILTEETGWIGGQLTSQAVPPDEHGWIEKFGCTASYRALRDNVRDYYRRYYPLRPEARRNPVLNPGNGWVSPLCHEPRVALSVLESMLAPYESAGRLTILRGMRPVASDVDTDLVRAVLFEIIASGERVAVHADQFIDATELGDLLPITGTEHVTGFESSADTGNHLLRSWPSRGTSRPSPCASSSSTWMARTSVATGLRGTTTGAIMCRVSSLSGPGDCSTG